MKKLMLLIACLCVFCFSGVQQAKASLLSRLLNSNLNADVKVWVFYTCAPRWLLVTVVDAEGEPVVGEEVIFNFSYREWFNLEDKQPFNPIEQLPIKLKTNANGRVVFTLPWCHGFVFVGDDIQEDGFGAPFKFYEMTFITSNSNTTNN